MVEAFNSTLVRGPVQQLAHFLVGRLSEIDVPPAHGREILRRFRAQHQISGVAQMLAGIGGTAWNGADYRSRFELPEPEDSGTHDRASGQSVVDQHDGFAGNVK